MDINIQTCVSPDLWDAIKGSYEVRNFTYSILDAIHYLTTVLRDKSGCDGDGEALVGQALGGNSPKLKINRYQTETEQNEQKGLFHLIVGLYKNIRNPRSHEQMSDSKETADAIILFINYLLRIITQSQNPFTLEDYLKRIFDKDFVKSERYATLLAQDIPENKRFDTLVEVYRRKTTGDGESIALITKSILLLLTDEQKDSFFKIITEELWITTSELEVKCNLQILPQEYWPIIGEKARLRIESKLQKSINEGEFDPENHKCIENKGILGAWSGKFLPHFSDSNIKYLFVKKLESNNYYEQMYVLHFFFSELPKIVDWVYHIDKIVKVIFNIIDNEEVQKILTEKYCYLPDNWRARFDEYLSNASDLEKERWDYTFKDEIPF